MTFLLLWKTLINISMQTQISLSNKEKQYYFMYLIGMLIFVVALLAIIFLYKYTSPFSNSDIIAIQTLQNKSAFEKQQAALKPLVDSTFIKTRKLSLDETNFLKENDIKYDINTIDTSLDNLPVSDPRKKIYSQISKFGLMYLNDKGSAVGKNNNIKLYTKQYEDCSIGYRDRRDRR